MNRHIRVPSILISVTRSFCIAVMFLIVATVSQQSRTPPKQPFISFPTYQSPSEERSASQKRTLAFYSATILAYFGNQAAYRAHLKKLCKSAAFFALFRSPASPYRKVLRRRTQYAGPCVPMPGSPPPKNRLLMTSTYQRPYEEEIGRPIGPI